ncbi:plasminogen-like [Branchiostoma floridae x Branchiostoma belcheri]
MKKSYPWELIIRLDCLDLLSLLKERVLWGWMVRLGYLGLLDLQKKRVLWEWMVRLGYLGLLDLQKKRVLWEWMVRLGYLGLLDLLKERVLWEWMVRLGYLGLLDLQKKRVLWECMVRPGCLGLLDLQKKRVLWEWMVRPGYLGLLGLLKERIQWEWMIIMKTPHEHIKTPAAYPSAGLEQNYCRNPDGEPGVWCFTTDPNSRWELCDVPSCISCQYADGASYRGTVSVTKTGKTCQRWDSQTPHEHIKTPGAYPSAGLERNYCRNPDGELGVWCFTTDPNSRWELCDVPSCVSCQYADGAFYRGTVSVTKTGKTCQRWDSQTPHEHSMTGAYPSAGLDRNYCRNPDGDRGVWCYTTDPSSRWELCDVPSCGKI